MNRLDFLLPDVGEGLDGGEIVEWHVERGSVVVRDQPLASVETDKALVEIPSPVNGTVAHLGGSVGDVLQVGQVLVVLETEETIYIRGSSEGGGSQPDSVASQTDVPTAVLTDEPVLANNETREPNRNTGEQVSQVSNDRPQRVLASPATRRLAVQLDVDLATVSGSGPGGRVTSGDVRSHVRAAEPQADGSAGTGHGPPSLQRATAHEKDETVPLRGLRRTIARTMTTAWRDVPHITEFREVDATQLVAVRSALQPRLQRVGVPFTYLPLLLKAVVAALAAHPKFNARIDVDAETITYVGRRNIGLATATQAGLIVPVLKDASSKSMAVLAEEISSLASAARDRSVTSEQMSDGTFTITNFGSYGGWLATPIIRPPEVAIAGFGRIRDTVVAADGVPVVRPTLPLSVSADHRLIDGADMGGFLGTLTEYLANPILLLGTV